MREKIENARLRAREARQRAEQSSDTNIKNQWLMVAKIWDELAHECGVVQNLRADAGDASTN